MLAITATRLANKNISCYVIRRQFSSSSQPKQLPSGANGFTAMSFITFTTISAVMFAFQPRLLDANSDTEITKPIDAPAVITSKVYMDVSVNRESVGRIVIGLHGNVTPITCNKFEASCQHGLYANSAFHRIIPKFMIQGGDYSTIENGGGASTFKAKPFDDENFQLKHTGPGVVSMANAGPNTNSSQFFITTKRAPHLDGKHVVFGTVLQGWDVVRKIEAVGTKSGKPTRVVRVEACGVLP